MAGPVNGNSANEKLHSLNGISYWGTNNFPIFFRAEALKKTLDILKVV